MNYFHYQQKENLVLIKQSNKNKSYLKISRWFCMNSDYKIPGSYFTGEHSPAIREGG